MKLLIHESRLTKGGFLFLHMPVIEIFTSINTPPKICFQLALSVDVHAISTRHTQEQIVGGKTRGVLQLGDSVTFRAKHFGWWHTLTGRVIEVEAPHYFCDEM